MKLRWKTRDSSLECLVIPDRGMWSLQTTMKYSWVYQPLLLFFKSLSCSGYINKYDTVLLCFVTFAQPSSRQKGSGGIVLNTACIKNTTFVSEWLIKYEVICPLYKLTFIKISYLRTFINQLVVSYGKKAGYKHHDYSFTQNLVLYIHFSMILRN